LNDFFFGFIKYFLQIEECFYVAINPCTIKKSCFFSDHRVRVPNVLTKYKKEGNFKNYYFLCETSEDVIIINAKDIISKCIIYFNSENQDF